MNALHRWCTQHYVLAATMALVATVAYLAVDLVDSKLAETVALGYLTLVGTVAVAIDWGRRK